VYGLPPDPKLPSRNLVISSAFSALGALVVALISIFKFRERGTVTPEPSPEARREIPDARGPGPHA
jgi:hypothetical protein